MSSTVPLELDVRPLFAAGRPPLAEILSAVNRLTPGQSLRLLAQFEPAPLYALLGERGFTAAAELLPDGTWAILFSPGGEPASRVFPAPISIRTRTSVAG